MTPEAIDTKVWTSKSLPDSHPYWSLPTAARHAAIVAVLQVAGGSGLITHKEKADG